MRSTVSLLSPRSRLALTPEWVALRTAAGSHARPCREPGWPGALRELTRLLADHRPGRACEIVLSQHFAASHLLPPPAVALDAGETLAWIGEQMAQRFPEQARDWRLAWQPAPAGEALLVGAMPQSRFDELLETLGQDRRSRPASVRTWFASYCDRHWRRLARGGLWLALAEPGRYTLAAFADGRILRLRGQRGGDDIGQEIAEQLARERLLGDLPADLPCRFASAGLPPGLLSRFGDALGTSDSGLAAMLGD